MMVLWCCIKGSKERCLLGQNTYKVLGSSPWSSYKTTLK